jgi:hypothetical protein
MTISDEEILLASISERRRAIFARVKARMDARGIRIDSDPRFLELVEKWIDGTIEISEVTQGYSSIRRAARKQVASRAEATPAPSVTQQQLRDDLDRVIGMYEPDAMPATETEFPK